MTGGSNSTSLPPSIAGPRVDAGMVRTEQDQVFGWFSGRVILDDGTAMTVRDLPGFAEKVWNRW